MTYANFCNPESMLTSLGGCIETYRDAGKVVCLKSLYFPSGSQHIEESKQWAKAWKIDRLGCHGVTNIQK